MKASQFVSDDSWLLRLITNHIGYVLFAIPIAILYILSKRSTHTRCKYT